MRREECQRAISTIQLRMRRLRIGGEAPAGDPAFDEAARHVSTCHHCGEARPRFRADWAG